MWWRLIIITLAYLLIGAHFLRFGHQALALISACLPLVLIAKHNGLTRLLQLGLILASVLVWGITTFELIEMRLNVSQPWGRLAAIMTGVISFTLFAAYSCNRLINQTSKQ